MLLNMTVVDEQTAGGNASRTMDGGRIMKALYLVLGYLTSRVTGWDSALREITGNGVGAGLGEVEQLWQDGEGEGSCDS